MFYKKLYETICIVLKQKNVSSKSRCLNYYFRWNDFKFKHRKWSFNSKKFSWFNKKQNHHSNRTPVEYNSKTSYKINPEADVAVLASIREPYFSRTKTNYTSHQKTPYRQENANHPAIYKHDNSIIVAHPLDKMNQKYGAFI